MENNDLSYIFMSALKHPYKDYATKESTSLLMKELDQAASYFVHQHNDAHSDFVSPTTSAGLHHQVNSINHRGHFNHHQRPRFDGLKFGSPKSPENVARTILRALGASEERHAPIGSGQVLASGAHKQIDARRRSISSGSISQHVLTNGHQQKPGPSCSLLSRCRRKLHLQLNRINGTANSVDEDEQRRPTRHVYQKKPSVILASNGHGLLHEDEDISESEEGVTPLPPPAHQFVNWPANKKRLPRPKPAADSPANRGFVAYERPTPTSQISRQTPSSIPEDREEHRLIALNSSLLMVKPGASPAHQGPQQDGHSGESSSPSDSSGESFAPPPPPHSSESITIKETAIVECDTPQSQKSSYMKRSDTNDGISVLESGGHLVLSAIEHHPPPASSYGGHKIDNHRTLDTVITPTGTTTTSTEPEPSPDPAPSGNTGVGLAANASGSNTNSTGLTGSSLQRIHNRLCTSFRLKVSQMKNPVDMCLLPNEDMAIADYDNGLLIVNDLGEIVDHKKTYHEVNACGVACVQGGSCAPAFRIFLLVVRDGVWTINVYRNLDLVEMARCPTDAQIENWALRRLVVCVDSRLHLMASGETKCTIWTYEFDQAEWRVLITENSGARKATSGIYNDMSVKLNKDTKETRLVLCEWRKAQLWTLFLNEKTDVVEEKSIKMKRIKGQEWIVQGPHLAVLDEQADILVYDGSGKLFLFDGETYRCKKIVADLGRGEVSALAVGDGWVYTLCRYRKCIEAFMYKEHPETHI